MAEISLEEFQRNQSNQISRQIIGQSEEHEQKMQINWQTLWKESHHHMVVLLQFLDKDYDEACEKSNHPLEKYSDNDLAYLIHLRVRTLVDEHLKKDKPGELDAMRDQLKGLSQKFSNLEGINAGLVDANKRLHAEIQNLNAHMSVLRQAQKDAVNPVVKNDEPENNAAIVPSPIPIWFNPWHESKTFEKMSAAILVMGETGMALRPSIIKGIAKRLSLSPDNNSLDEALSRLLINEEGLHPALVDKIPDMPEQGASSGGNAPDVLQLTEEGKEAYRILTGKPVEKNEYVRLVRSHSSPEHTILNIQATEILVEAGYRIKAQAQAIQLNNGGSFIPDIIAVEPSTGEMIFVEVERDAHKDQVTRKQKWINLNEASNGNLYVFCDNLSCQRTIQGEINLALGGLTYNSFLTNLHGLRNGKRSEKDGGIWLSVKKGK